jgi:hypothetical protein
MTTLHNLSLNDILQKQSVYIFNSDKYNKPFSSKLFQTYKKDTSKYWTKGKYWLCKQIELSVSEPITDEIIYQLSNIFLNYPKDIHLLRFDFSEYQSMLESQIQYKSFHQFCLLHKTIVDKNIQKLQLSKLLNSRLSEHSIPICKDIVELIYTFI